MIDFLVISTRNTKRGIVEIYPKFIIKKSSDLMIRGGDFYAIWIEERGLWSTDEQDALQLIDRELDRYAEENRQRFDFGIKILHMWDAESGMIDTWHKYCQRQMRDSFHMLDEKLIFSNTETKKKDYASKKLSYPLESGDLTAYNRLMSTLYIDDERHKIEWAIGSVVSGESKKLQKFIVLYGATGTGKSTVLNIIQQLFEGYYSVFDARALGSSNNDFALEAFKSNPLVAIQHDGDLSKIEDNTRLNTLVSHEMMIVNEKFKTSYSNRFKCFLFMGTNKPVKITDAKSGLIRRLIDVSPSGNKLKLSEYTATVKQIAFELGAIAHHCQEVYLSDPDIYNNYLPIGMLGASNDFYNFIIDSYHIFKKEDGTTLKVAWEMYKTYCDEAKVTFPFSQRIFKEELKNYFWDYKERFNFDDGSRARSYYIGFRTDKFEKELMNEKSEKILLKLESTKSILDKKYSDCKAQYANSKETPVKKWENVTTKLSDLDTTKLHYVILPENHIVIDFDLRDKKGEKSIERNIEEASKWPSTYAEYSKSGKGIHLHYIYVGDVAQINNVFSDGIEIKTFTGNSAIRRKVTLTNDLPVTVLSSGLPMKGEKSVINFEAVKNEKNLRTLIKRNLNKEIHPGTKPSIDFIYKILEDAYSSGLNYDITDMRNAILAFAASSTNQADYCIKLVNKMQFKSLEQSKNQKNDEEKLIFFDVEVFPNLFLVNWKIEGLGKPVVRMINPSPSEIEDIIKFRLVGFNCRRYDNHILYGRLIGYSNEQLFNLSQKIINGSPNCFFGEAYNISYTDVYDFSSEKQSLKKFEIDLGISHRELGLPWDQPVPEDIWIKVAEYCDADVIATEAIFNARKEDFVARQILADLASMTVNDTTNTLTTKIIFGGNRKPQDQFNYRDMGKIQEGPYGKDLWTYANGDYITCNIIFDEYTIFDKDLKPIFPGYKYEMGKSTYRGEEVGEGGHVYSEPGIYGDVASMDISSMYPSGIVAENLFGTEYTQRFKDLLDARIAIKHKDFKKAKKMLDGALAKYLSDETMAKGLAGALKIALNSVYGLTSASFENAFYDKRNVDNIVAKRGALFMINLKHEVQEQGFKVAHIKTDSIKIPDATSDIINFVMDYGKAYGYTFEHEATYDKLCLLNDAVYVGKYKDGEDKGKWQAIGTQLIHPYVFKTLFKEGYITGAKIPISGPIEFKDMCETKTVTTALYLDMNEELAPGEHNYHFIGKVGQFCPIKEGCGGGILLRESINKKTEEKSYNAVTGTKNYRWLESEMIRELGKEDDIDISYYEKMVKDAMDAIWNYGMIEWFLSDKPYLKNDNEIIPF